MSSTSSGCQPKRSASSVAVSTSGATVLTQVRPLAESDRTGDSVRVATGAPERMRDRLRRGRLGIGTERVVNREHHFSILPRVPAFRVWRYEAPMLDPEPLSQEIGPRILEDAL